LLRSLNEALTTQRGAIAAGDAAAVNDSVEAIGRVLLSIEEAAGRRAQLLGTLPGAREDSLTHLEAVAGEPLPENLLFLRAGLRRQALEVAREAEINKRVLAQAMDAGEAFLMTLFSAVGEPAVAYAGTKEPATKRRGAGVLLNRTA
jgi:hypothetical protein